MATNLDSEFASVAQQLKLADQANEDRLKRQQADDRSLIARTIIGAFVLMLVWVVVAATLGAYWFDWATIEEPAKFLATILGSIMLPVVTLVIGHYFSNK